MAKRILLGKSVSTGLGHSSGSPKYGLWVSKSGIDVTANATTPDELGFNSDLYDATSGITTKGGMGFGVVIKGHYDVSTSNVGSGITYITWPESDFTKTTTGVVNGTTSSSNSVSIDTANSSIVVGMTVTGSNVGSGVTVTAISNAITITLSSNQSIVDDVTLTFSIVYAPLCFVQIGKTTGTSPSIQYSNTFYINSLSIPAGGGNKGCLATVYPRNRTAGGAYSASGTYGAIKITVFVLDLNSSYRVYYAICHPGIDN